MDWTTDMLIAAVRAQLAVDLNCEPSDFTREGFVFCEAADLPGRRPFPRDNPHLDMVTMGKAIVVSASPEVLPNVKTQLEGKSRDEAFSAPFVYGHSLYYLPSVADIRHLPLPAGFELMWVERPAIPALYETEGFRNALSYDASHPRPDVLAALAMQSGVVAGMAGVSADCEALWQVGIDVPPAYRGRGLAVALVSALAAEVLRRGHVPYYGTASSNVASQRVAFRAGFFPAWMCSYMARFADVGLRYSCGSGAPARGPASPGGE